MRNTDKFRGCLIGGAGYTFDSFEVTKTNRKAFDSLPKMLIPSR